jgi:hypothetical protein
MTDAGEAVEVRVTADSGAPALRSSDIRIVDAR